MSARDTQLGLHLGDTERTARYRPRVAAHYPMTKTPGQRLVTALDRELHGMLLDRSRLLHDLAHVLRRVGASNPDRAAINRRRSVKRQQLRRDLRRNADDIAARLMALTAEESR